jgi:flagellar basal body-associated protein FliL
MLLPAILAAAAAFGGAKFGSGDAHGAAKPEPASPEPGPTVPLEAFLVTLADQQKSHVLKLSLAIELKREAKEEELKIFIPRIRDTTLTYLRGLTFEEAASSAHVEQMRKDLIERFKTIGVASAERVLITDFVTQ